MMKILNTFPNRELLKINILINKALNIKITNKILKYLENKIIKKKKYLKKN